MGRMPACVGCCGCLPRNWVTDMNQNPPTGPAPVAASTAPQPVSRPVDRQALTAALAGIRADSLRDPENYLLDTVVPNGGE
jgi:hypothetical protein